MGCPLGFTTSSKKGFEFVREWCRKRHIKVVMTQEVVKAEYEAKSEDNQASIYIPEKASDNIKLYSILHECGHHLIGYKKSKWERYSEGYNISQYKEKRRTLRYRVEVLDEELEAWNRGIKLAKRLKIYLNLEKFKRFRDHCIKSYANRTVFYKGKRKKVRQKR